MNAEQGSLFFPFIVSSSAFDHTLVRRATPYAYFHVAHHSCLYKSVEGHILTRPTQPAVG